MVNTRNRSFSFRSPSLSQSYDVTSPPPSPLGSRPPPGASRAMPSVHPLLSSSSRINTSAAYLLTQAHRCTLRHVLGKKMQDIPPINKQQVGVEAASEGHRGVSGPAPASPNLENASGILCRSNDLPHDG